MADVAGHEHAGHARLEEERVALERPPVEVAAAEVRPGADEPALVAGDRGRQPVGVRRRADEHEEVAAVDGLRRARLAVDEADALEVAVALAGLDLGVEPDVDPLVGLDPVDEVLAHALGEVVAADEHGHAVGVVGKVEGALAGRVAGADDEDVLAGAAHRLGHGRAVVHAAALELGRAAGGQLPPVDAGGQHERGARELAAVGQLEDLVGAVLAERRDLDRRQDLDAEPLGLGHAAAREVGAGEAGREAEVVLDPARRAGLPAGRLALQEHGLEPLARPVHRRRQPRRPAADDGEVVELALGLLPQPDPGGEVAGGRGLQPVAALEDHEREFGAVGLGAGAVVALDVLEPVRHVVAREEVAEPVALGAPAVGQEAEAAVAGPVAGLPVGEEVVEGRVELVLGRVPGLEEVVVDAAVVDGGDGRVGVGVGRQEDALRPGRDVGDLAQQADSVEPWHPLVGEDEGDGLVPVRELADGVERLGAGAGPEDAVGVAVAAAEVAGDGAEDVGVVVHADDRGVRGVGHRRGRGGRGGRQAARALRRPARPVRPRAVLPVAGSQRPAGPLGLGVEAEGAGFEPLRLRTGYTCSTSASAVRRLVVRVNFSAMAASTPRRPAASNHAAGGVAEVK